MWGSRVEGALSLAATPRMPRNPVVCAEGNTVALCWRVGDNGSSLDDPGETPPGRALTGLEL